ncbi:LysR family transcriptional regulator [Burkholderia guangdongensis]|uniref:LysR family transcriptional regulator n=1 Tax=Burkholderia guangdongensis TaxID=1792500 RepID=UPI0015CB8C95|nr:LysR family transcriptional regulator [Burkholderia guangdongensis]
MWNEYYVFVIVAETLSFGRAAKRLGQQASSVSRAVSRLEEHLALRLFDRAPKVQLTEAGERLYVQVARHFDSIREAERALMADNGRASGTVRAAAPLEVVRHMFNPAIARMIDEGFDVQFEIEATARVPNLVEGHVDLFVSHHRDEVSSHSLVTRRLCTIRQALYASPALFRTGHAPRTPDDLLDWPCLTRLGENSWTLFDEHGAPSRMTLNGPLASTPAETRLDMAVRGYGITVASMRMGDAGVARGKLVRVLPGHRLHDGALYAYLLARRLVPRAVEVFLRYVTDEALRQHPDDPAPADR